MLEIYKPFGIEINLEIDEPNDLVPLLCEAEKVIRFDNPNLPSGLVVDDSRRHIRRGVAILEQLDLPGISKYRLIRMFWLHDLVEIKAGDVSIVAKNFMTNAQLEEIEKEELDAASSIFTPFDIALFTDFQNAETFLRGVGLLEFSEEGIVANCADKSEGNMYFHYHLSRWAQSDNYDPSLYDRISDTLEHTFTQYIKYMGRLDLFEKMGGSTRNSRYLLDLQTSCIKSFWYGLGDRIPPQVIKYLFVPNSLNWR